MKDFNYPIFYTDGTCIHCSKKTVVPINKMGRIENRSPIYPLHFMKCTNCGREYFIRWDDGDDEEFSKPIPVSFNYIQEFTDILESTIKQNK